MWLGQWEGVWLGQERGVASSEYGVWYVLSKGRGMNSVHYSCHCKAAILRGEMYYGNDNLPLKMAAVAMAWR